MSENVDILFNFAARGEAELRATQARIQAGLRETGQTAEQVSLSIARETRALREQSLLASARSTDRNYLQSVVELEQAQQRLAQSTAAVRAQQAELGQVGARSTAAWRQQLTGLASGLTGPAGAVLGVGLLANKVLDFAEASANTAEARAEFGAFQATVDGVQGSLGRATAAAIESTGVLDAAGAQVEALGSAGEGLLGVVEALGPAFEVVSFTVEMLNKPLELLGDGLTYVTDLAQPLTDGISSVASELSNAATEAVGLSDGVQLTGQEMGIGARVASDYAATLAKVAWQMQLIRASQREEEDYRRAEVEDRALINRAYAVAAQGARELALSTVVSESEARQALELSNRALDERGASLQRLRDTDLMTLPGGEREAFSRQLAAAEREYAGTLEQTMVISDAITELEQMRWESDQARTTAASARDEAGWGAYEQSWVERIGAAADGAAELDRIARESVTAQAGALAQEVADQAAAIRAKQQSNDKYMDAVRSRAKQWRSEQDQLAKADAARSKAENKARQESYAGLGDIMAGALSEYAGTNWGLAVMQVYRTGTQMAADIAEGKLYTIPLHTATIGMAVAEQALASSMGAKKKGSGGAASAGGSASSGGSVSTSAPQSELAARQSGDRTQSTTIILQADGREWARGQADNLNANARYGVRLSTDLAGRATPDWITS